VTVRGIVSGSGIVKGIETVKETAIEIEIGGTGARNYFFIP